MVKTIGIIFSSLISIIALCLTFYFNDRKTAYVDMGRLFDEFKLSSELRGEMDKILKENTHVLDSMEFIIKMKVDSINKGKKTKGALVELENLEGSYFLIKRRIEEDNRNIALKYNEKIWNQINQYVFDYGDAHGYKIILGASGEGNIMYGDKSLDLTVELTEYINNKYDGIF